MFLKKLNLSKTITQFKQFPTPTISNKLFLNKIKYFSSSEKEDKNTINVSYDNTQEQTIDITQAEEIKAEKVPSIKDLYNFQSKKMDAKDPSKHIDMSKFEHKNVKLKIFKDEEFATTEIRNPIPISPRLGPYEVVNPKLEGKTYHWCACGMSNKQPFCDGAHKNGKIRPLSFKLGEKVDSMLLCGCKLSTLKPFCDKKTCIELQKKEEEEVNKICSDLNK